MQGIRVHTTNPGDYELQARTGLRFGCLFADYRRILLRPWSGGAETTNPRQTRCKRVATERLHEVSQGEVRTSLFTLRLSWRGVLMYYSISKKAKKKK